MKENMCMYVRELGYCPYPTVRFTVGSVRHSPRHHHRVRVQPRQTEGIMNGGA